METVDFQELRLADSSHSLHLLHRYEISLGVKGKTQLLAKQRFLMSRPNCKGPSQGDRKRKCARQYQSLLKPSAVMTGGLPME
jgi:hypothetical protein